MKKRFLFQLATALILTLSASANAGEDNIIGRGRGGSTHGDQDGACGLAYGRALNDAEDQCFQRNGQEESSQNGGCQCHRESPHDPKNIACDADLRLVCEVPCLPQDFTLNGSGLDVNADRDIACGNAFRRAQDNTNYACTNRQGFVTRSNELSCDCQTLISGEYQCTSNAQAVCEVQNCQ